MPSARQRRATTRRGMIELEWGDERHPRIAIVGKGVVLRFGRAFDDKAQRRQCG
jgi:hypothetical protein